MYTIYLSKSIDFISKKVYNPKCKIKKGRAKLPKVNRVATNARKEHIMTYRELYTNVVNGNITEETVEMAKVALAKLDERNAKRASTPTKTAIANEPIKASIVEWLSTNGAHVAKDIGVALGITTAKASSLCGQLVKDGILTATEIKVPKAGKRLSYALA